MLHTTQQTPTIVSVIITIFIVISGYCVSTPTATVQRLPLVSTASQLRHVRSRMVIRQWRATDICICVVDVLTVSCGKTKGEKG